jgi:endo-1,4-beta-xylanase
MISRRTALAGSIAAVAQRCLPASAQEFRTLRSLAAAKGVIYGAETATYDIGFADFAALLPREAALLVPGYEMKRDEIEKVRGQLDFSVLDRLFAFAKAHGMLVRGHPLVWYFANPPWLGNALAGRRDETILTGYVSAMMRRYRGRLHSVDVVNEAIATDGNGLRPSPWLSAFGPSYIDMAFHAAHAADPDALLTYNDWGCEQGGAVNDRFRATTLKFLDGLLDRGVPVQALGLQSHLAAFGPHVDQRKLRDFLREIEARRLAILVTELDVEDSGGPSDTALRDQAVADEARRFLDVVLDSPATRAVVTWGLSDRYLDPPDDWKLRLMGWHGRTLPYDAQLKRKPLWSAIAQSFQSRRVSY